MLEIRKISKKFYTERNILGRSSKGDDQSDQELQVVNDLSLTLKKGEVYGFLGPNGAGKTTTVKIIAGLLFPDKGEVSIGKQAAGTNEAQTLLGFMPENPQFYRHLKAIEVLRFAGELFELDKETIATRSNELLKEVGLSHASEMPVRNFSKGMHQRLAFAVALMNDPKLLVLDEPLDGLDPLGRLDFKKLISRWKKEGRTIFFSSHILGDAEEICDRVGILVKGKLLAEGSPKSLTSKNHRSLEEYFVELVRKNA